MPQLAKRHYFEKNRHRFCKHSITLLWSRISKNGPYLKAVEVTYNAADLSKAGETEINMVNTMLTYGDSVAAYLDASGL